MSKTIEQVMLIPGEAGWEAWSRQGEGVFSKRAEWPLALAGQLEDLPSGDLVMCFPARMVTALPLKVATEDASLFADLVTLHAERLGLRTDPLAGQLSDWFEISKTAESSALLSVFLKTPVDGDLPKRGPKGFDLSARAFPVEGSPVVVWKEFGRWVFALHRNGTLVYAQATGVESPDPDDALARDIQLAVIQLEMQGMEVAPSRILVWTGRDDVPTGVFSRLLGLPCELRSRPAPLLPQPLSRLLPADVRAARRAAQQRRNLLTAVAAGVMVYLGLIGWLGYGLWSDSAEARRLVASAERAAPDAADYSAHIAKWDELAHVLDITHSPVDILNRISECIPPNSGLRLKSADVSAAEIKLMGEAPSLEAVNSFSLRLSRSNELTAFSWQTPEPNNSTRGWEFVFAAELPQGESQP